MPMIGTAIWYEVSFTREQVQAFLDTFRGDTFQELPTETVLYVE